MLVPLDGSRDAESILPALVPLLRSQRVSLDLIRTAEPGGPADDVPAYLARLSADLERDGIHARWTAEWGQASEEILNRVRRDGLDLIAMTTHGRSGVRRAVMGSVTEDVLRRSEVPLIVNRPESKVGDWSRIVVPLDGSDAAEEILPEAIRLARPLGSTLHLVIVRPAAPLRSDGPWGGLTDTDPYLKRTCDRIAGKGVMALSESPAGIPADEIVNAASRLGAGLVCMTSKVRSGLPRVLLGSTAEQVLRRAPCPVLVRKLAAVPARPR